ncbi:nuclear transport factor 2-like [Haliotis rubra]|uniref:nuclear transport factor 2-like n=1 Tax=Haliotis rubra TaxID=36100 RepID=UPI001EE5B376|nr:nuclear transport factor 2-like [Haliotis rubra]
MGEMEQCKLIAHQFVQNYYETLDKIVLRQNLTHVYTDETQMMYEGQLYTGKQAVMEKLMNLPGNMARMCSAVDALIIENGYLLVNIMGQQKVDQDPPLGFVHSFVLAQKDSRIFIAKEIFRLVLHDV